MINVDSIKVFGSGCPSCKKLYEVVAIAAAELGINTEVEYISDIQKMLDLGIMSAPALAVNDKILLAGRLVDKEKIKELFIDNGFAQGTREKQGGCCGGHDDGGCCGGGGGCHC